MNHYFYLFIELATCSSAFSSPFEEFTHINKSAALYNSPKLHQMQRKASPRDTAIATTASPNLFTSITAIEH
jgi:hypothetical protein